MIEQCTKCGSDHLDYHVFRRFGFTRVKCLDCKHVVQASHGPRDRGSMPSNQIPIKRGSGARRDVRCR